MIELGLYARLAVALAIGLLIGLERGWRERTADKGRRVAGFRTFTLIGLCGGFAGLLAEEFNSTIILAAMLGLIVILGIGFWHDILHEKNVSATTMVAALLTFLLGSAAVMGYPLPAAAAAVIATLILSMRQEMHGWLARLERHELSATLRFLLISVVVLPLLPNEGYGPYEGINPYVIWWMVVLISGLSFAGYITVKLWGKKRGLMLTAAVGALVSSTAITLTFGREARQRPEDSRLLAAGVIFASTIMVARVAVVVAILAPALLWRLAIPLAAMAVSGFTLSGLYWLGVKAGRDASHTPETQLSNPFELSTALFFGIGLGLILLVSRFLEDQFGSAGLYSVAVITGFIDVDAMTISASQLFGSGLAANIAATAIIFAALANSLAKALLGMTVGRGQFARYLGLGFAGIIVAGLLGLAAAQFTAALT